MRVADELRAPGREGGREGMKYHMVQYSVSLSIRQLKYCMYITTCVAHPMKTVAKVMR